MRLVIQDDEGAPVEHLSIPDQDLEDMLGDTVTIVAGMLQDYLNQARCLKVIRQSRKDRQVQLQKAIEDKDSHEDDKDIPF